MVLPSLHSVLMDPEYWKDPETFRPERFLDHSGENLIKEERLIPFGLGERKLKTIMNFHSMEIGMDVEAADSYIKPPNLVLNKKKVLWRVHRFIQYTSKF